MVLSEVHALLCFEAFFLKTLIKRWLYSICIVPGYFGLLLHMLIFSDLLQNTMMSTVDLL